jgi:DNA repair exonuclease SbcCD ATPase subunit/DNA repair exonuclease SbcCD nuclease subunit
MRIAHLADIHIQDRRRAEYAQVFEKLYESLRVETPDIIVVAGDVFDNKMRASAHNLEDVANFLIALVEIAPVILIAGNHDTNCLVPGSLDLLTPVVTDHKTLQEPRLTYLRHSGSYNAHGIVWTVIATDGGTPPIVNPNEVHICLFHEEVSGAFMPNGMQMRDFKLTTSSFSKYDLALGGHIHLRQQFTPRAGYCGSLVQQNIGELHYGHGYMLWEFYPSKISGLHTTIPVVKNIDIPNDYGFVRIEIDAVGRDITHRPIPKFPLYWELCHDENTPAMLIATYVAEYETLYGMEPRAIRTKSSKQEILTSQRIKVHELEELVDAQAASQLFTSHEEIIRELLAGDSNIEAIIELHRARWQAPKSISGGKFRILRLEFDNMYAFGSANVVDFTALENCVSGIIAPNHTGKSSLIEALLFALYEEYPRAPSKKDIINRNAKSCNVVLDFELDGKLGKITKSFDHGSSDKHGSQYKFEYAGENRTRGGTVETLSEIESVLGKAANALASSFQLQSETGGFIGTTPANRKKLIASVMALGSFESLERTTAKELTECGGELKALAAQYHGISESTIEESLLKEEGDLEDSRALTVKIATLVNESQIKVTVANQNLGIAVEKHRSLVKHDIPDELINFAIPDLTDDEKSYSLTSDFTPINDVTASILQITKLQDKIAEKTIYIKELEDAKDIASKNMYQSSHHIDNFNITLAALEAAKTLESELANALLTINMPVMPCVFLHEITEQKIAPEPTKHEIDNAIELLKINPIIDQALALKWNEVEYNRIQSQKIQPKPVRARCEIPHPEVGERRGEQYTKNEINMAKSILAANKSVIPWDPVEYARLDNILSVSLNLEDEKDKLYHARELQENIKQKISVVQNSLTLLGPEAAITIFEKSTENVDTARDKLTNAKELLAIAMNAAALTKKLNPQPNCIGCDYTKKLLNDIDIFDATNLVSVAERNYKNALATAYHDKTLRLNELQNRLEYIERNIVNLESTVKRATATDIAQKRINALAIAKKCHEAKIILESDNYWASRDIEHWRLYDESQNQLNLKSAEQLLELKQAKKAFELINAESIIKAANYWAARRIETYNVEKNSWELSFSTAKKNHEEALIKLDSAIKEHATAELLVKMALKSKQIYEEVSLRLETAYSQLNDSKELLNQMTVNRKNSVIAFNWKQHAQMQNEQLILLSKELMEAQNIVDIHTKNYTKLQSKWVDAQRKEQSIIREIERLKHNLAQESTRAEYYHKTSTKYETLKSYRAVLRPTGGIGDRLLERGRNALESQINSSLRELGARFCIELKSDYDIAIKVENSNWLPVSLGSGYQRFVLSLAGRLAIWRLSSSPRPDAFIIDEGFGACDDEYLDALATALETLATTIGGPRLVFVVSHVDTLKARLERALEIELLPHGSKVVNAIASNAITVNRLTPDLETPGYVYCKACKQSIKSSWELKHLASAKHLLASSKL